VILPIIFETMKKLISFIWKYWIVIIGLIIASGIAYAIINAL